MLMKTFFDGFGSPGKSLSKYFQDFMFLRAFCLTSSILWDLDALHKVIHQNCHRNLRQLIGLLLQAVS